MSLIYGHRGASADAPENTLRAFALAAEQQADGVELDVQLTRDGQLVVFHDENLARVTGEKGRLCDRTWEELRRLPIRLPGATAEDGIPLLSEVLTLLHNRGLRVNIELKNSEILYDGLEERCLEAVARAGMEERTLYSSFNHISMVRLKRLSPSARCGLLYSCTMVEPWRYAAGLGMDALHPHYSELQQENEVPEAHAAGLEVNPWTVNSEEALRWVIRLGADRIITNEPGKARALLKAEQTDL